MVWKSSKVWVLSNFEEFHLSKRNFPPRKNFHQRFLDRWHISKGWSFKPCPHWTFLGNTYRDNGYFSHFKSSADSPGRFPVSYFSWVQRLLFLANLCPGKVTWSLFPRWKVKCGQCKQCESVKAAHRKAYIRSWAQGHATQRHRACVLHGVTVRCMQHVYMWQGSIALFFRKFWSPSWQEL